MAIRAIDRSLWRLALAVLAVGAVLLWPAPDAARAQAVVPVLQSLDPAVASTAGGTVITVTGTDLDSAAFVFVDETEVSFTPVSATQIQFTAPANEAGTTTVTVTNADGTPSNGLGLRYEIPATPAPVIDSLTPRIVQGSGGTPVTIMGSNLTDATVNVGDQTPQVTSNTATTVVFVAPPSREEALIVTVSTPGGGQSNPLVLDYQTPDTAEPPPTETAEPPAPPTDPTDDSPAVDQDGTSDDELPATGVEVAPGLAVALSLILFGSILVAARRPSRR